MRAFVAGIAALVAVAGACAGNGAERTGPEPGRPLEGVAERGGLEYAATIQVMESFPVQLAGTVTITNTTDERVEVTFPDGCVVLLRAYRPEGSEPVWDQASEVACTMALVDLALEPGESREFGSPAASAADVLGDDLPDGTYRVAVYLRPGGEELEIFAGTVELVIPR
ncbi:MAG: BsuPI-related putative proteinase inhibitor [Gemmatimonadota bacterium]|nr:BsuPI-related putative proteinase inhibitor [Gemmatimonadota bacterium]